MAMKVVRTTTRASPSRERRTAAINFYHRYGLIIILIPHYCHCTLQQTTLRVCMGMKLGIHVALVLKSSSTWQA